MSFKTLYFADVVCQHGFYSKTKLWCYDTTINVLNSPRIILFSNLDQRTMASTAGMYMSQTQAMMKGGTLSPPHEPVRKHKTGRFCVKVHTQIMDTRGEPRYSFKGYGPDADVIKTKTIAARDQRCRPEDCVTEPFITTLPICDVCDNRIEVFDVSRNSHYYIM